MSDAYAIESSVLYRIMNAEVKSWPFPHFFVPDVFPPDAYRRLIAELPADSAYSAMGEHGTVGRASYKERLILSLERGGEGISERWRELAGWMLGDRFTMAMLKKFLPFMRKQWGDALPEKRVTKDARLVRDFTHYALSPHTDMREKALAFLFYLPEDTRHSHLGTSVYVPNDPGFHCPGGPHHPREGFTRLFTTPYQPNALFGFVRTDHSFHGVEPVTDADARRDLLLYNLYLLD